MRPEYRIADIGCGPGRFAVAFARRVHWVTGFDLSPRMIHYGMEHARREGVENVTLRACDFQTLDVRQEGLESAFDLVFSSLTPAIHGRAGLEKVMAMSRAYCCNITHIAHENSLRRQIREQLFGRPATSHWGWRWFYSLFNVLLLLGYLPEASYDHRAAGAARPAGGRLRGPDDGTHPPPGGTHAGKSGAYSGLDGSPRR